MILAERNATADPMLEIDIRDLHVEQATWPEYAMDLAELSSRIG